MEENNVITIYKNIPLSALMWQGMVMMGFALTIIKTLPQKTWRGFSFWGWKTLR